MTANLEFIRAEGAAAAAMGRAPVDCPYDGRDAPAWLRGFAVYVHLHPEEFRPGAGPLKRQGAEWADAEIVFLCQCAAERVRWMEAAAALGRSYRATRIQASRLGIGKEAAA